MDDCFLTQHVSVPTRKRGSDRPSTIDLVFTDHQQIVKTPYVKPPLKKSDHGVVIWSSTFRANENKEIPSTEPKYNFFKGNYKGMQDYLASINWNEEFSKCTDIDDMAKQFEKIVHYAIEDHVPLKKKTRAKPQSPWIDFKTIKAIRRKYHAWKRFQVTKSHARYLDYIKERDKATKKIRKAKRKFEKNLAKECSSNPKAFFRYVNSYKKKSTNFIRLKKILTNINTDKETLTNTDKETADELNAYFKSVFTTDKDTAALNVNYFFKTFVNDDHAEPFDLPYNVTDEQHFLKDVEISKDELYDLLKAVNPNKSAGDDGIHSRVLQECAKELVEPLYMLFKYSLNTSTVPKSWKSATITPLFKTDDRSSAENYRPISITSQVIKILEKIVRNKLMDHLIGNEILSKDQHGFCLSKSCMTNLLETLEYITSMVDEGFPVDEVFLDFRKAFDKVSHERLLYKLDRMGVKDNALLWLSSFLSGRKQRVRVNGAYSSWGDVTSGVPQGSVLGPLLFVAFINDMPDTMVTNCKLFADDTKVYGIVKDPNDVKKLQEDLQRCHDWSVQWNMEFHPTKCKVLHFGKKNKEHQYLLGDQPIQPTNHEKDLGIVISDTLGWAEQIKTCVAKANRMIGIIKRTFSYINKEMFLVLYKTFIRPHLEYCPEVWSPHLCKDIEVLEKVQRRATKLVLELKDLPYEVRLTELKLFPLKERRVRGDMITTYKLLHGLLDVDTTRLVPLLNCPINRDMRSHDKQIHGIVPKTNMRRYFFSQRIVLPWNTLSKETVNSPSVESFKANYDKERLSKFI